MIRAVVLVVHLGTRAPPRPRWPERFRDDATGGLISAARPPKHLSLFRGKSTSSLGCFGTENHLKNTSHFYPGKVDTYCLVYYVVYIEI